MDISLFVDFIIEYGYIALFLSFYIGLIGLPVPNEVAIMTGGLLSSLSYFDVTYAFLIIYSTIILNATSLYIIGRLFGEKILRRIKKHSRFKRRMRKASLFLARYGSYGASVCYFIPFARHIIPFLLGSNRYSYALFAVFSYSTAFIWAICLFMIGRLFGNNIEEIGEILSFGGYGMLLGAILIIVWYLFFRRGKVENQGLESKLKT